MKYDPLKAHRRAQADYRLALGLDLKTRRETAGYSFTELAMQCYIPVETLRAYEKGQFLAQIMRLVDIGAAYGVSAIEILNSTAEYIYRASGEPIPDPEVVSFDRRALQAVLLYCGVTPEQLRQVESSPPSMSKETD